MVRFEGYERRINKINSVLAEYGIKDLEDAKAVVDGIGVDVDAIVRGIQPICFDNAVWAYTLGTAIAVKRGLFHLLVDLIIFVCSIHIVHKFLSSFTDLACQTSRF